MFRNNLVAAFRSLARKKTFTIINAIGLAVGASAAIVLALFAQHELGYDHFHENKDNIYQVYKERITPDGTQPTYDTWVPLLEQMQLDFPEVRGGTRLFYNQTEVSLPGGERFSELAAYVDTTFFNVFSFPLKTGQPNRAFNGVHSAVITQGMARKLFGDEDPLGQSLVVDFNQPYIVSGVCQDFPSNSTIEEAIFIPITSNPEYTEVAREWGSSFLSTYILLDDFASKQSLESKFPGFIEKIWDPEVRQRTNFRLLPLLESYDTFIGDSRDSYILLSIALGIILIASINFMNLATASAMDQAREIGMRKVLGSYRSDLIIRFYAETLVLVASAMVAAVLLSKLVVPWLNTEFNMQMDLMISSPDTILILLLFTAGLTLLSGAYPSFFLSGLPILTSLKGRDLAGKGAWLRKGLVVIQYTLSIMLLVGTAVIWLQINFMKSADMSFDKENLIVLEVDSRNYEDRDGAALRMETFRNEIRNNSSILGVSTSTHVPTRWSGSNVFVRPEGWQGDPLRMRITYHDANFFETYGIRMLQGPGFLPDSEGNQRTSVVLNQAAVEAFGYNLQSNPARAIAIGDRRIDVVGVIENFNYETLRSDVDPILHFHRVPTNTVHRFVTIRVNASRVNETLEFVKSKWAIVDNETPISYFFLDDSVEEMYANEDRILMVVSIFSLISMLVAGLGLFGLSSFMVQKRQREIGIRKVLGARPYDIIRNISSQFLLLIGLGLVIAIPVSYFLMEKWLSDFAHAITLDAVPFALATVLILTSCWLAIGFKVASALKLSPVTALKDE